MFASASNFYISNFAADNTLYSFRFDLKKVMNIFLNLSVTQLAKS